MYSFVDLSHEAKRASMESRIDCETVGERLFTSDRSSSKNSGTPLQAEHPNVSFTVRSDANPKAKMRE